MGVIIMAGKSRMRLWRRRMLQMNLIKRIGSKLGMLILVVLSWVLILAQLLVIIVGSLAGAALIEVEWQFLPYLGALILTGLVFSSVTPHLTKHVPSLRMVNSKGLRGLLFMAGMGGVVLAAFNVFFVL